MSRAPSDLRMPISCVRSVTTASMMVHDHDAAHDHEDADDADRHAGDGSGEPFPEVHDSVRGEQAEVIVLAGPEVAVGAEQHAHLVFGLGQLAGESACPTEMGRHSWRKAAMGSRRAAFTAGQRPKNRPTLVATPNPATTLHSGTVEGRLGTNVRIATESSQPARMPIRPPDAVRVMASSRNCQTISLRRAPTALRTPISRVRSVTDTSMMFITPMPPTSRPMDEITTMTRPTELMSWRNWPMTLSALEMPKLSGSAAFTRRRRRSSSVTSSLACSILPGWTSTQMKFSLASG